MDRVCVFIDGSNLYHGLKAAFPGKRVQFDRFAGKLVTPARKLIRAYYYNVATGDPQQQKFLDAVRLLDYFDVKLGRLVQRGADRTEKGVDVLLSIDMLEIAFRTGFDVAILVSGDGDFAPVVDAVKRMGKQVENAYVSQGLSLHLRATCDRFLLLDQAFMTGCWE